MNSTTINEQPISTVSSLVQAFPGKTYNLLTMDGGNRTIPIGIEIEITWRAYFPDLWVQGFPNIDKQQLAQITEECRRRERVLLPGLMRTNDCGIPSGADKYWEFAFNPVTDVNILRNQVHILQENNLIPPGKHALHITIGGMRPSPHAYYLAMILEAHACDKQRVLSGLDSYGIIDLSKGWARKGRAGLFEKQGNHDMQHGYEYGTEFRLLFTPPTLDELTYLLDRAQYISAVIEDDLHPARLNWMSLIGDLQQLLRKYNLPVANWGRPHENRETWESVAAVFNDLAVDVREAFEASPLS